MMNGKPVLTVYHGCMFAGKTDRVILDLLEMRKFGGLSTVAFYHKADMRAASGTLSSHTGERCNAYPVEHAGEILQRLEILPDYDVIAIDEAQFLPVDDDPSLLDVVRRLLDRGKKVIVAGLDLDFRGQPFGLMPAVVVLAQVLGGDVYHLKAICQGCGAPATMSQRLLNGEPARYDDEVVIIGADELYEARCPICHVVRKD